METSKTESVEIVGRDAELAAIRAFVSGDTTAALLIVGESGLGKTALWSHGVAAATAAGATVLVSRPAEAEARYSYVGLIDLFDGVASGVLRSLPSPQRQALSGALLLADSPAAIDRRAIGPALLGALRRLAGQRPVLIAIDDAQWLDRASADAVAFAAVRLRGERVRLLVTRRSGPPTRLEQGLVARNPERLELGPLSLGAIRRLLLDRLGIVLTRRAMRILHEQSGGNPLFAVELAQAAGVDGAMPVAIEEAMQARLARVPAAARAGLLAVALGPRQTPDELLAAAGAPALEAARDLGLVIAVDGRLRAGHPLLASVAVGRARGSTRRAMHAALAGATSDDEQRLRHLSKAATGPDEDVARALDGAVARAVARGAADDAAELAQEALRLTPASSPARPDRVLALAERLMVTGDHRRVVELVGPALESVTPAPLRARTRLLVAEARFDVMKTTVAETGAAIDAALQEGAGDPAVTAIALARRSHHQTIGRIDRVADAERDAERALELSRDRWPDAEREALQALAWARHVQGHAIDDLQARFNAATADQAHVFRGIDRIAAERLLVDGSVSEARAAFERILDAADARGEALSFAAVRLQLIELELRAGAWDRAAALLDEWSESAERELTTDAAYERLRALLAAGRGDAGSAREWADLAVAHSTSRGLEWDRLEALRARALAARLDGRHQEAASDLRAVWEHTRRAGELDPGVFPVAADLVEVLVETGERDAAREVALAVRQFAGTGEHRWARATARRCGALVEMSPERYDVQAAELRQAAADLGAQGLAFDHARTLLALGRAERRLRKWGLARRTLEEAAAGFDRIGSPGWVAIALAEQGRISARRPTSQTDLTPSQRRVAELAAEGLANKEIGQALGISVDTVETHLSRAFEKLGVDSRGRLARRLARD